MGGPDIKDPEEPKVPTEAIYNKQDTRRRQRKRGLGSYRVAGLLSSPAKTIKSSILGQV